MDFNKWLTDFKVAHRKAGRGELAAGLLEQHHKDRDELARAVFSNRGLPMAPSAQPRAALKTTRVLPIELELGGRLRPLMTLELSSGGFSVLAGESPGSPDKLLSFTLKLPGDGGPISGHARCLKVDKHGSSRTFRCELVFDDDVGTICRERIEHFVFDDLLANLTK